MSEHTRGPWHYDGGAQIVEAARPHMRIAFLPSDHHKYAESTANARLIAAAPDYAAAVEQMIAYEAAGGEGWWTGWCALKDIHAKATGGSL